MPDGISFAVDRVAPATALLPTRPLSEALAAAPGGALLALSEPSRPVVAEVNEHPLLAAVHLAFAQHRPLVLSPDVIWTAIAQGFALHVNLNAERLRERLVRHQGKLTLEVKREAITKESWPSIIADFTSAIREHVGPGMHRLLVNDFSTTGPVERTASEVVMMNAFQRFFDYVLIAVCGIPTITLRGTPEDWAEIRRRLDVIAEYELGWWIEQLAPVCDQLVETAAGRPDLDFWQCIYMPKEVYGGKEITGWFPRLFPYIETMSGFVQNPVLKPTSSVVAEAAVRSRWISE